MTLPPLNALRAFEAAARLASLSRAGDELHVTHAAVSHQIRHLETWLGRRLFERAGRGIALTPAGEAYFQAIAPAFAALSAASLAQRRTNEARSLTVGCIPSIAARWLVPALPDFSARHPGIDLRIVYARAQDRFDEEACDVLITLGADARGGLASTRLFSRANRPVASPHYRAAHPRLTSAAGIAGADLLHDETLEAWAAWFAAAGVPAPKPCGPVFQDFNLLATAVIAGHGVALCPVEVFRREIERGDLVVLSPIATLAQEGYFMISRAPPAKAVRGFVDWFAGICAPALA